uniref:Uncharacterized protein n=1 Tax=Opuntia streptacantha TaxID=393608 RepID=A0A7C9EEZ6_OPUST
MRRLGRNFETLNCTVTLVEALLLGRRGRCHNEISRPPRTMPLVALKVEKRLSSVDGGETRPGRRRLSDEGGWRNRSGDGARGSIPEVGGRERAKWVNFGN